MKKCLLILISLVLLSSNVQAKEKLTWLVVHWPPFQMLEGIDMGKGRYDALLKLFRKNLLQYEHRTIKMNWARFWNDIKKGEEVCSTFSILTKERQQIAEFSSVVAFGLPLRIIMRKSSIAELDNPESISLVRLLQDSKFKGIIIRKRSYFKRIDEIFKKYTANIQNLAIAEGNIILMLLSERTDYTIEYPYVADYLAGKSHIENRPALGSIGIEELMDFYTSHLACPKTTWGKKVVKDFDIMLKKVKPTREYLKIMQMWHSDPLELKIIEKGFKEIFLQMD